jgi:hypothetical protein
VNVGDAGTNAKFSSSSDNGIAPVFVANILGTAI